MLIIKQKWWVEPLDILMQDLATTQSGLTKTEAKLRQAQFGLNIVSAQKKRTLLLQFLSRFRNPLVILLLVASLLSAFTSDITSFIIIVVIAAILPYTPLGTYFGFVPLPPVFLTILMAMGVVYLVMVELVKHWFYRKYQL